MLEWLTNELMKLEAENKAGAHKGEHCPTEPPTGTRVRRFDTRLEPPTFWFGKLRKEAIPLVTKKETLEQALPESGSEAFINGVSTLKDGMSCSA